MKKNATRAWAEVVESYVALKRPSTQTKYRAAIRGWLKFLGHKPVTKATDSDGLRWAKKLAEGEGVFGSSASRSTVYHKIAVIKEIYHLLQEQGLIAHNPLSVAVSQYRGAGSALGDKRPTELVPFELVPKILEAPSAVTKEGQRDRCYLALLFGCALRAGEAVKLNLGDVIELRSGQLALQLKQTKNHSDAVQPIPGSVREYIARYVATRKAEGGRATDPLLIQHFEGAQSNRHMRQEVLARYFRRYMKAVGVPGRVTPHSARATAITYLLERGLSHREVRKFSRHSSVAMVEKYDKLRDSGAEAVAQEIDYKKIGNE